MTDHGAKAGGSGLVFRVMFGPLNGVRVALVVSAFFAAVAAFITGYPAAGWVLLIGVVVHGFGWLYLYRQRGS